MKLSSSPLRYPGGKSKIYEKVKNLITVNHDNDRTYVEPFAGGFTIGIGLLQEEVIQSAILNDLDSHLYNFWYSVLNETNALLRLISDTPITIKEREHQKLLYADKNTPPLFDGFATLFLNRVNFSGIIKGGVIGGKNQSGSNKMDCRFNKEDIKKRIEAIARLKNKITLCNLDANCLIETLIAKPKAQFFFNMDPPYVMKGSRLYEKYFTKANHILFRKTVGDSLNTKHPWIITYDKCFLVQELYQQFHSQEYNMTYSARNTTQNKEVVITNIPTNRFVW